MPRNINKNQVQDDSVITLPSDNKEMETFINENKIKLLEETISAIEFALNNNLSSVELFKFKNSDYIITISEKDYLLNINHIYASYLKDEKYELLPRIVKLQSVLNNLKNYDKKEIEINGLYEPK